MFGRKKAKMPGASIEINKLSSLIADNVEIVGDVIFSGGLRVDGSIKGNVRNKDDERALLVLSEQGRIEGSVKTHDAVVNGTIVGDLTVGHFLELQANARVTGNITYRQLQMDCGASVDGTLEKTDAEVSESRNVVEFGDVSSSAAKG